MNKPRILVTSAAGRTSSVAVLELLRKEFRVRAFVRRNEVRRKTRSLKASAWEAFKVCWTPFPIRCLSRDWKQKGN